MGKKEEMVKALMNADIAEEAAAKIKSKLTSMSPEGLSKLVAARGLSTSKSKNTMVEAILSHEAEVQTQVKAFEAKMSEFASKEKQGLQTKTASTDWSKLQFGMAISTRVLSECSVTKGSN